MTEHSAQHMFLLRPLLLQGLSDLFPFFQGSHSLSHASGSLSPSKPEREDEHQKIPSDVEKWVVWVFSDMVIFQESRIDPLLVSQEIARNVTQSLIHPIGMSDQTLICNLHHCDPNRERSISLYLKIQKSKSK